MNSYVEYLENEWKYLEKQLSGTPDVKVYDRYKDLFIKALQLWNKENHSGASANFFAPRIAEMLKNLMLFRPIVSVQSEDELQFGSEVSDDTYQSTRLHSVFKKNGKIYYLEAIIWKERCRDEDGEYCSYFTGIVDGITSKQCIRFPFYPRSFFVEVERDGDDYRIIDIDELKKAFECYDFFSENQRERFLQLLKIARKEK